MELDLKGVNISLTDEIAEHTRARITGALDQYKHHVREVVVRLKDVNGPRGGKDKECDVEVKLLPASTVVVKEAHDDLYSAISLAADRVKNAVGRKIERSNHKRG